MPAGRPTLYNDEIVAQAVEYIDNYEDYGHAFPSVVGLCSVINRGKSTIYDWAADPEKEFSDILARINEKQELVTFNKSITNEYNATIAKLLLGKHGYSDKLETENYTEHGGAVNITVVGVDGQEKPIDP